MKKIISKIKNIFLNLINKMFKKEVKYFTKKEAEKYKKPISNNYLKVKKLMEMPIKKEKQNKNRFTIELDK